MTKMVIVIRRGVIHHALRRAWRASRAWLITPLRERRGRWGKSIISPKIHHLALRRAWRASRAWSITPLRKRRGRWGKSIISPCEGLDGQAGRDQSRPYESAEIDGENPSSHPFYPPNRS